MSFAALYSCRTRSAFAFSAPLLSQSRQRQWAQLAHTLCTIHLRLDALPSLSHLAQSHDAATTASPLDSRLFQLRQKCLGRCRYTLCPARSRSAMRLTISEA